MSFDRCSGPHRCRSERDEFPDRLDTQLFRIFHMGLHRERPLTQIKAFAGGIGQKETMGRLGGGNQCLFLAAAGVKSMDAKDDDECSLRCI
jgi:hypothetical protein